MHKIVRLFFIALFIFLTTNAQARSFHTLFTEWTNAFNNRNLAKSCDLFSKKVVADYQGTPHKNYGSLCGGFKKVFSSKTETYQYSFKLHHVYESGNLAAIRITWFLRIYENKKLKSLTQDEGIDIFEKDKEGQWKIVNYIGYPVMPAVAGMHNLKS